MKKKLFLVLTIIIIVIVFIGCRNEQNYNASSDDGMNKTEEIDEKEDNRAFSSQSENNKEVINDEIMFKRSENKQSHNTSFNDNMNDTKLIGEMENDTNFSSESESDSKKIINDEKELIQLIYGKWLYQQDNSWAMEIRENTIIITIKYSGYIELKTYELTEVNPDMNYIIINIKNVYKPADGEEDDDVNEEVDYLDKIIVDEEGLTYIYKYNKTERNTSFWIKDLE